MCDSFTNIFLEAENKWTSKVRKRVNGTKNPQWMTNNIKLLINRKKNAYLKYKKSKTNVDFIRYVTIKRCCEKEIRKAKRNYEINISRQAKTNAKKFYQYIRSKKSVKEKIVLLKDVDNVFVSECKNMALILNNLFDSVFISEDTTTLPNMENLFTGPDNERLKMDVISVDDIIKHLQNLNPNKSTGADNI